MSGQPWEAPEDLPFHCQLCPEVMLGMEAAVRHLVDVHGEPEPERWPDGGLVTDTTALADDIANGGTDA